MQWTWTSSNYQMSVIDCCWHWQDTVLAAGCQPVISIYLLSIPRTPQTTWCELRFIQLVTSSLFLSLRTLRSPHSLNPLPLVRFCPHTSPLRTDVLCGWPLSAGGVNWFITKFWTFEPESRNVLRSGTWLAGGLTVAYRPQRSITGSVKLGWKGSYSARCIGLCARYASLNNADTRTLHKQ